MAGETGIGWCDATVNFVIGCTEAGPGCDRCYARVFSERKFPLVKWGPGGHRHVTQSGFTEPLKWQRMHDAGKTTMRMNHKDAPVPVWIFACSLSDFFDNEWPDGVRDRAWEVIKATPSLRWILVTKRVGNVAKMLPADWEGGRNYPHVGIVATMVNQEEIDRDAWKLGALKNGSAHVRWVGASIEPQLGPINPDKLMGFDWIITGGESKQDERPARNYDQSWATTLVIFGGAFGIPVFVKQMGDSPMLNGKPVKFKGKGDDVSTFPEHLRVQQRPRVYDNDPIVSRETTEPVQPNPKKENPQSSLF